MDGAFHASVLLEEVVRELLPQPRDPAQESFWLDGTLGLGGHAAALLDAAGPGARLLGMDKDAEARDEARSRLAGFGERVRIIAGGFEDMAGPAKAFLQDRGGSGFDGILLDLGVSSLQLDKAERGFSFSRDAPLDMRMDRSSGATAARWLAEQDESSLKWVLREYGEEPRAGALARKILELKPQTTRELAGAVSQVLGPRKPGAVNPATRVFQAIRIAVNGELDALDKALPVAEGLLKRGGRLAVISFHSLEDRRVKQFIQRECTGCVCPPDFPVCVCGHEAAMRKVTRKALTAGAGELERNPRARSARLRVAEKL